jgi:hypothetical protein
VLFARPCLLTALLTAFVTQFATNECLNDAITVYGNLAKVTVIAWPEQAERRKVICSSRTSETIVDRTDVRG